MDTPKLERLLTYVAAPFVIITGWAWLQPAMFPRWAYGAALFTAMGLIFFRNTLRKRREKTPPG